MKMDYFYRSAASSVPLTSAASSRSVPLLRNAGIGSIGRCLVIKNNKSKEFSFPNTIFLYSGTNKRPLIIKPELYERVHPIPCQLAPRARAFPLEDFLGVLGYPRPLEGPLEATIYLTSNLTSMLPYPLDTTVLLGIIGATTTRKNVGLRILNFLPSVFVPIFSF